MKMWCPKCKENIEVDSWETALTHLQTHEFTEEEISEAKKKFEHEMGMVNNPYDAYAGCSEWEALGVSPEDQDDLNEPPETECPECGVAMEQFNDYDECPECGVKVTK